MSFVSITHLNADELNDYSPRFIKKAKLLTPPDIQAKNYRNDYRDDISSDVTHSLASIVPFAGEPDYEFVMEDNIPHFVVSKTPKWHAGFSMNTAPFSTRHDRDMENQYNTMNAGPIFRIRYSFD